MGKYLDSIDLVNAKMGPEIRMLYRLCREIILYGVFLSSQSGTTSGYEQAESQPTQDRLEAINEEDEDEDSPLRTHKKPRTEAEPDGNQQLWITFY